jgi:hypothetical protein
MALVPCERQNDRPTPRQRKQPKTGGARVADSCCSVREAKRDRPMLARRKQRKAANATGAKLPYLQRRAERPGNARAKETAKCS